MRDDKKYGRAIGFRYHDGKPGIVEGLLSRGDRRVGRGDRGGVARRRPLRRLERALLLRPLDGRRRDRRWPAPASTSTGTPPASATTTRCCPGTTSTPASTRTGCGVTGRTPSRPPTAPTSRSRTAAGRPATTAACAPRCSTEIQIGPTGQKLLPAVGRLIRVGAWSDPSCGTTAAVKTPLTCGAGVGVDRLVPFVRGRFAMQDVVEESRGPLPGWRAPRADRMYVDPADARARELLRSGRRLRSRVNATVEGRPGPRGVGRRGRRRGPTTARCCSHAEVPRRSAAASASNPTRACCPYLRRSIAESGLDVELREVALGAEEAEAARSSIDTDVVRDDRAWRQTPPHGRLPRARPRVRSRCGRSTTELDSPRRATASASRSTSRAPSSRCSRCQHARREAHARGRVMLGGPATWMPSRRRELAPSDYR